MMSCLDRSAKCHELPWVGGGPLPFAFRDQGHTDRQLFYNASDSAKVHSKQNSIGCQKQRKWRLLSFRIARHRRQPVPTCRSKSPDLQASRAPSPGCDTTTTPTSICNKIPADQIRPISCCLIPHTCASIFWDWPRRPESSIGGHCDSQSGSSSCPLESALAADWRPVAGDGRRDLATLMVAVSFLTVFIDIEILFAYSLFKQPLNWNKNINIE